MHFVPQVLTVLVAKIHRQFAAFFLGSGNNEFYSNIKTKFDFLIGEFSSESWSLMIQVIRQA